MSNSISQLPETVKRLIFFHRGKASQSVAAFLGLIMMAYPYSKLLAKNPLSIPAAEGFIEEKTKKESSFLDDLINHHAYVANIPPEVLNPNRTDLIFAMNYDNVQGAYSGASAGAQAAQPQPLLQFQLPLMNHAQITAVVDGLHTGLDLLTTSTMLSLLPVIPSDNLSIATMLYTLIETLNITLNESQAQLISMLFSIEGTASPVNINDPQQAQVLAILILSYYTAIYSAEKNSKASTEKNSKAARFFFQSFLIHATSLCGIGRIHTRKGDLLGTTEPIRNPETLKENVKKSVSVYSDTKSLQEIRLRYLLQIDNPLNDEKPETPIDPALEAAIILLNYSVNNIGAPLYQRHIKSDKRMLKLIKEYGTKNPGLIALSSQFVNLIDAISLALDPSTIQLAIMYINNLSSYFSHLNWDDTITDSSGAEEKKQKLFIIFKTVLIDAKYNPGHENPKLFEKLLLSLQKYIDQQLKKQFTNKSEYRVIMLILCTGFSDLLEQAKTTLAMLESTIDIDASQQAYEAKHGEAAQGWKRKQPNKKEEEEERNKRKYLKERISYLEDFLFQIVFDHGVLL